MLATPRPFRLLGPIIDEKLLMHGCIDKLYRKAKPKARVLLRCRRYYSIGDMPLPFKSHVRIQIECCNGAIYHASPSQLTWLDTIQTSFLRHLELEERQAFLDHNVAPMSLRRDIRLLGVLWKVGHGKTHPDFEDLFPNVHWRTTHGHDTRIERRRHDLQLFDPCDVSQLCKF